MFASLGLLGVVAKVEAGVIAAGCRWMAGVTGVADNALGMVLTAERSAVSTAR